MSSFNDKPKRELTAQIRPSLTLDTIITLEALQKDMPLGKTIENLLNESPTYQKKKEELRRFKSY